MKKFALCLITCIAMNQSIYAATPPITESLLEYEAITFAIGTDPDFIALFSSNEFIVDIKRLTKRINILGEVKYEIVTRTVHDEIEPVANIDQSKSHSHFRPHLTRYTAVLLVAPNPGIGPNIITVLSITENCDHYHDSED